MGTQFTSVSSGVAAALLADPVIAGGHVLSGRNVPMPAEHDQAVRVSLVRSNGSMLGLNDHSLQWQTALAVEVLQRAPADGDADAAIDPLLGSVFARLAAMAPPPGAVSVTLDPAIVWDVEEGDQPVISATLQLIVTHITTTTTLE